MENKKQEKSVCPEAVVGALIVNQDGLILLGKNKKWENRYTIFGGHVDLGESLEDAVKREAKEETGLEVEVEKKVRFADSVFSEKFHQKKHLIFLDFICRYQGEKDSVKLDEREYEADSYVWVDPEGALKMDIEEASKNAIERYLEEKKQDEYLAGWKRCMADFENYKKRQLESNRFLGNHAKEEMILQLLPVVDNFEASVAHVPEESKDNPWVTGIMHIQKQVENILEENGVKVIETKVGDEFNPEIHEALKSDEKGKGNKIDKIVQKGYKMGDKIIRAVKVIVK